VKGRAEGSRRREPYSNFPGCSEQGDHDPKKWPI
jgi:hypothetical protein